MIFRKIVYTGAALLLAATGLMMTSAGHGQVAPAAHFQSLSGFYSGIRVPRQLVIRSAREWALLWREHAPDRQVPPVDFRRNHVVAVFAGTKPTGGFEVVIGEIRRGGRRATVNVTLIKPGRGTVTTLALTQPSAMRVVPRLPDRVEFITREREP